MSGIKSDERTKYSAAAMNGFDCNPVLLMSRNTSVGWNAFQEQVHKEKLSNVALSGEINKKNILNKKRKSGKSK